MQALRKLINVVGGLFVLLIVLSVGSTFIQTDAAKELCSAYKVGDQMPSIEQLDDQYFLQPMGPFEHKEIAGAKRVIFCASATMCDVACEIVYNESEILSIEYESH